MYRLGPLIIAYKGVQSHFSISNKYQKLRGAIVKAKEASVEECQGPCDNKDLNTTKWAKEYWSEYIEKLSSSIQTSLHSEI